MGFYLTEQSTGTAAESRSAVRRSRTRRLPAWLRATHRQSGRPAPHRRGAKTRIGVPTGRSILSTKYLDQETGLYYYGYRFYNPSLGRWPSRDPVGEEGNVYAFIMNAPVIAIDPDGQLVIFDPVLLNKITKAMEQLKDCYGKMVNANDEARKLWDVANQAYSCCAKGKPVPLSSFPGAVTGEPASTYGVLHCLTGYRAKKNGVGRGCLDAANFLWETWEFINPRYW